MRAARRISVSPSGPPVSATTTRSRASQVPVMSCFSRYCWRASSTRSAVHSSASSRRALRLPGPEVVRQRGVDLLGRVDVAVGQAPAQRLGGHVLQLDLVGRADDRVGHRLALRHAGDLLDHVVERLQVLDVDGGDDVDAGGQQLLDVLPALGVAGARGRWCGRARRPARPSGAGPGPRRRPSPRTWCRGRSSVRRGTTSRPSSISAVCVRPWVSTNPTTTSVPRSARRCPSPSMA